MVRGERKVNILQQTVALCRKIEKSVSGLISQMISGIINS